MSNRNWPNKGNLYTYHCKPVLVDCVFTVSSSNSAGLGITGLLSSGLIKNVFMHTSATPGSNNGTTNPNPASGVIMVQFSDNYKRYLCQFSGEVSALTTAVTSTTNHVAYVITSLGTATTAQWVAAGVPVGITPATNVAFIAIATGTIGGSAQVAPTAATGSGIDHIEVLGSINKTCNPNPTVAPSLGGHAILQCFSGGTITAPTDGAQIRLQFYFDDSSVLPGDGG